MWLQMTRASCQRIRKVARAALKKATSTLSACDHADPRDVRRDSVAIAGQGADRQAGLRTVREQG